MAKNGKKGAKNLIVSILVPIIILVMLASAIIAVIDGIVGIIVDIIVDIINFFKDPVTSIRMVKGKFSNEICKWFDLKGFDSDAYLDYKLEPTLTISDAKFKELMTGLDAAIDRDTIDLTDLSIKKMLLTYYRTSYLTSYIIRIQLTQEEWDAIQLDSTLKEPYTAIQAKDENDNPIPGEYYIQTTGCIHIIKDKGNGQGDQELYCFTRAGLDKIKNEYDNAGKDIFGDVNIDYKKAVQKVLEYSYTLPADGAVGTIEMYKFTTKEITKTYSDKADSGKTYSEEISIDGQATLEKVYYTTNVSQYTVPVEFLTELLNITGSMEFIEEFMKLVEAETSIDLRIYETSSKITEETEETYTHNTKVTGKQRFTLQYNSKRL